MTSVWLLVFPLFCFTMFQTLYLSSDQKAWLQQTKDWSDHYKNLEIFKGKKGEKETFDVSGQWPRR